MSIDIADVDVGRNIEPNFKPTAEADKRIAQAKAEERRAMAIAKEQEMKVAVQEMWQRLLKLKQKFQRQLPKL